IVLIGVAVGLWINRRSSTDASGSQIAQPSSEERSRITETARGVASANVMLSKVAVPTAPQVETVVPKAGGEPAQVVRVHADQVLATVNGVAISLKDLAPLDTAQGATDQLMSPEMYEFLLNRAIDREVTIQTARAQGLELSAEQRQQLDQMRASL